MEAQNDQERRIIEFTLRHYGKTFRRFGPSPLGVDWDSQPGQYLRLLQLLKICDPIVGKSSIIDYGCGYGALWSLMHERGIERKFNYLGIDLCATMIRAARKIHKDTAADFMEGYQIEKDADYIVASGIFNVKGDFEKDEWEHYVDTTLRSMFRKSRAGMAVNFMRTLDVARIRKIGLYRTVPERWIAMFERVGECTIEIVDNYGLNEFTLLCRRRC